MDEIDDNNRDIQEIVFFGGQDTDTALEGVAKGNFLYALNILNNSSGEGNKGIVTTLKGNLEIPFELPDGTNKNIGTAEDHEHNIFYLFNWNEYNYHGIYQFDGINKTVNKVLLNLIDTGDIDILKFDKDYLILHADVVRRNLLYWVDALNKARKTNINKLFDKTTTGYGATVLESFIDAYKSTSDFAPTAEYFSDTSKKFNRLYGALRRFTQRYIYDDGEKSNWSDFSAIALPDKEPFTGIKTIPTNNNGLYITVETGDATVVKIEIAMQSTIGEANNEGILDWQLITTIDKGKSNISNNSTYVYKFYNDSKYPVTPYEKVIRPFNFMPRQPVCQSYIKGKLVYSGGKEGFDYVPIDVSVTTSYTDLFLDSGTENEYNKPSISITYIPDSDDYMTIGESYIDLDGSEKFVRATRRARGFKVTIGHDVKDRNEYFISLYNGGGNFSFSSKAKSTDTATTVANNIKAKLISTGAIIRRSDEGSDHYIYDNTLDGDGNVSFSFMTIAYASDGYFSASSSVQPVLFNTLKDTGESIRNIKLGSTIKLGIEYEDFDGRKSMVYTVDALIVGIKTINELVNIDGKSMLQKPKITLQINHRPPKWAKYFQIVRSPDLVYDDYIQILIQKVVDVQGSPTVEFQYLVIGSLITYNKAYSNSNLQYSFTPGDRIRLVQKTGDGEYYNFFETEIVEYLSVVDDKISSNVVVNGSNIVTVAAATVDNIGKFIVIDGIEREIIATSTTTYELNAPIGGSDPVTHLYYNLIDRRGVIRIRKPSADLVVIEDLSTVEIFKPAQGGVEVLTKQFHEFQKKFRIINAGRDDAYHDGNAQAQTNTLPAIIEIGEGTAYVRNRELPITNNHPGTQVHVSLVEDPSFSDFYPSLINDNGRPNVEDVGVGEVVLNDRMRFSNNSIENTEINGLNDFDSQNREDYNDSHGIIKRTVADGNNIYVFKSNAICYVPIDSKLTSDDTGSPLRVGSGKFLNPIQYLAWEGGVGDNPEAYCSHGTHKYIASANSGVIIRIGGNGAEPISKTFYLDKEVRGLLKKASLNHAKIFLGFNQKLGLLVVSINGYEEYIYFDGFKGWKTRYDQVPPGTEVELVSGGDHGIVTINENGEFVFTPDEGYVGKDHFIYRVNTGSGFENRKVCIEYKEIPNRTKAWRPRYADAECDQEEGVDDGTLIFITLEEYYQDDNSATGQTKPNLVGDPDYVAQIQDLLVCPVSDSA